MHSNLIVFVILGVVGVHGSIRELNSVTLDFQSFAQGFIGPVCIANSFGWQNVREEANQTSYMVVDARDVITTSGSAQDLKLALQKVVADAQAAHAAAYNHTSALALVIPDNHVGSLSFAADVRAELIIVVMPDNSTHVISPNPSITSIVIFVTQSNLERVTHNKNLTVTGLIASVYLTPSIPVKNIYISLFILKCMSLFSILSACTLVIWKHQEVLTRIYKLRADLAANKKINKFLPIILIVLCIAILLLNYYFYDVMVYLVITLAVIGGANSMSFVFVFVFLHSARCRYIILPCMGKVGVNVPRIVMFFVFLCFTGTWCYFRNHPDIGWIMQDIIGICLLIYLLTESAGTVSMKVITVFFAIFIIYDVFFVYITPLLSTKHAAATSEPGVLSENLISHGQRTARAVESIMEAVATGSAGKSGEKMPLVFKVNRYTIFPDFKNPCLDENMVMLGFGDAFIPGLLCLYLAFYDACWKLRCYPHLMAAIIGYFLGGCLTTVVLLHMQSGQPALLYLCPMTLLFPVIYASIHGGRLELSNLWNESLPHEAMIDDDDDNHTVVGDKNVDDFPPPQYLACSTTQEEMA